MIYNRSTKETQINLSINDINAEITVEGLPPFLTHLTSLLFFYSGFGVDLKMTHDTIEDFHHAFEDLGIAIGACLKDIQRERGPLMRYNTQYRPMDEALVRVSLDLSGRCGFYPSWAIEMENDTLFETIQEFYMALSRSLNCTLHIDILKGQNRHHIHEACFKALGAALKEAFIPTDQLLSTKGVID